MVKVMKNLMPQKVARHDDILLMLFKETAEQISSGNYTDIKVH